MILISHLIIKYFTMALFDSLALKTIFILLSFSTVNIIGWKNNFFLLCVPFQHLFYSKTFYLFLDQSCNWSGIRRPFCWVIFKLNDISILVVWPITFPCRVNFCRNALIGSVRLLLLTSFECPPSIKLLLISEIDSIAAIWLDCLNWYCKTGRQFHPSNDLPVAANKTRALLVSRFPIYSCTWFNPPIFNSCWLIFTYFSDSGSGLASNTSLRRIFFKSFVVNIITDEPKSIIGLNLL